MYSLLIGFACLASASVYLARVIRKRVAQGGPKGMHLSPLPPGPKPKPLIGNLLDIPLADTAKVFEGWRSLYGDIIYLEALSQRILVLGSFKAANDLLVKHSTIYSDRPSIAMLGELIGLDKSFPLLGYCAEWRRQRKLAHLALSSDAIKGYRTLQEEAVELFLDSLVENPSDFASQLRLASGRLILSMTYGVPITSPESMNFITELEAMMVIIGKGMMPGAYLVDVLPWLRHIPAWVPFNNIHTIAKEGHTLLLRIVGRPLEYVMQQVSSGSATTSFTATCLELEGATEMEHQIRWSAGSMYGAGSETTMGTVLTFILAMALYPDVQIKIRMEIDHVVGHGERPTLDDRSRLPYVNAAIKETMRWNPVVPLCLPHYTSDEDIYEGFRVPKGTIVFPNIWAISRDNVSGIAPDQFAPERFLDTFVENTALDPYLYAFGFGKRICPGKLFADNSVFLFVTGLIASFVISPTKPDEKHALLKTPFRHGIVRFPESFHASILPRSEQIGAELKERARNRMPMSADDNKL